MISTGLDTIDLNLVFNSVDLLHGQTGRERRVPVGQQEGLHPVLHALPFWEFQAGNEGEEPEEWNQRVLHDFHRRHGRSVGQDHVLQTL